MVPHAAACSALHSHESCRHTGALAVCVCRRTLATSFANVRFSNPFGNGEVAYSQNQAPKGGLLALSPPLAGWSGFSWTAPTLASTRLCPLLTAARLMAWLGRCRRSTRRGPPWTRCCPTSGRRSPSGCRVRPMTPPPPCCPGFSSHHPRATSHFITRRLGGETSSCIGGGEGGVSEASDG